MPQPVFRSRSERCASRRSGARRRSRLAKFLYAAAALAAVAVTTLAATGSIGGSSRGRPAGHVRTGDVQRRDARGGNARGGNARGGNARGGDGSRGSARIATAAGPNLRPGSDPSVLPGPVLIADRDNNRLVEVSPTGSVLWRFPPAGGRGRTLPVPDDVFFSPDGKEIVATEEDYALISVIDLARDQIVYRYGHPGIPGFEAGYLHNPDDAMMTPSGDIFAADIMNCRVVVIRPPSHRILRQLGRTGECVHVPGVSYASPNGAFPTSAGGIAITEIGGDWLDVLGRNGRPVHVTNPPGLTYPSDTNEVRPGVFLSADYTRPGAIEEFTASGRLLWRYAPRGEAELDHPSLALPLPSGDVIANDDRNDRVIVVDPRTNRIVWQYGHTGVSGRGPGYLSNPDGVDLAPPHSLAMRFRTKMRAP